MHVNVYACARARLFVSWTIVDAVYVFYTSRPPFVFAHIIRLSSQLSYTTGVEVFGHPTERQNVYTKRPDITPHSWWANLGSRSVRTVWSLFPAKPTQQGWWNTFWCIGHSNTEYQSWIPDTEIAQKSVSY